MRSGCKWRSPVNPRRHPPAGPPARGRAGGGRNQRGSGHAGRTHYRPAARVSRPPVVPWRFQNIPEVFVARITRKELKSDTFAVEVGHTLTFFEEHRQYVARYGAIAAALIILIAGYFWYSGRQHSKRQEALYKAIQIQEMPVGPIQPGAVQRSFPTQDVKDETA